MNDPDLDDLQGGSWGSRLVVVVILLALGGSGWFAWKLWGEGGRDINSTLHTPEAQERAEADGYIYLHFDRLRGLAPGEQAIGRSPVTGIPDDIRSFDGKRVMIEGFTQPLDVLDDGRSSRFLLYRHLASCCFGEPPQRNEWVEVRVTGNQARQVALRMGDGVGVRGVFRVGDLLASDGITPVYYILEAEEIEMIIPY